MDKDPVINYQIDVMDKVLENFEQGIKNGKEKAKDNGEWISVENRLPEERGRYLVYISSKFGSPVIESTFFTGSGDYPWLSGPVTHWQPLPEPPHE